MARLVDAVEVHIIRKLGERFLLVQAARQVERGQHRRLYPRGVPPKAAAFVMNEVVRTPRRLSRPHMFQHTPIVLRIPLLKPIRLVRAVAGYEQLSRSARAGAGRANEAVVAWQVAIERSGRPVALVLTRQDVPVLDRGLHAPADGLRRGAYILWPAPAGHQAPGLRPAGGSAAAGALPSHEDPGSLPDIILIASGSEVSRIIAAGEELGKEGIRARVVSMPSWETL